MASSKMFSPVAAVLAVVLTSALVALSKFPVWGVIIGALSIICLSLVYFSSLGKRASGGGEVSPEVIEAVKEIAGEGMADLSGLAPEIREPLSAVMDRMDILAAEVAEISPRDSLTSLAKEDVFNNVLWREFSRAERYGEPMSVALMEVGGLSALRKEKGDDEADRTLKNAASIVLQMIRETDLASRYGDDRIAIVMPATDSKGGGEFVQRLLKAVADAGHGEDGLSPDVSVAAGAATVPEEGVETAPDLVQRASKSLAASKSA